MNAEQIVVELAAYGAAPMVSRGRLCIWVAGRIPPVELRDAAYAHEAQLVALAERAEGGEHA